MIAEQEWDDEAILSMKTQIAQSVLLEARAILLVREML
jgi:hypothetical protein